MRFFAILRWSHAEYLLENTTEITGIFKPALHGYVPYRHIVGRQQPSGLLHAHMQYINSRTAACNYTDFAIELGFAYAHLFGNPVGIERRVGYLRIDNIRQPVDESLIGRKQLDCVRTIVA